MKQMTPVAKKVLDYAEKQMRDATANLMECEAKRKGPFSYWLQWNFQRMVANERKLECWTVVWNAILKGMENGEGLTDEQIKLFLIRYRNDMIKQILQSTNKNSTNAISVEIEIVQEDVLKKFAGMSCIDTGSLAEILYNAFGVNVRGEDS